MSYVLPVDAYYSMKDHNLSHEKRDFCTNEIEFLLRTSPLRNKHSIPSLWLQQINQTITECDAVVPFMKKMKENLADEGLDKFKQNMNETVETERISSYIINQHGKEIDNAIKSDFVLKNPFTYVKDFLWR